MQVIEAMKSHPYITAGAAGLVLLAIISRSGGGSDTGALIEAGLASKSINADVTKAALAADVQRMALQIQGMDVNASLMADRNMAAKEMYLGGVQAKTALALGNTNAMITGFLEMIRSGDTRAVLESNERVKVAEIDASRAVAFGAQNTAVEMLTRQLTAESAMTTQILGAQTTNLNSVIQSEEYMRKLGYDSILSQAYINKEVELAAIKAGKSSNTKAARADERASYVNTAAKALAAYFTSGASLLAG